MNLHIKSAAVEGEENAQKSTDSDDNGKLQASCKCQAYLAAIDIHIGQFQGDHTIANFLQCAWNRQKDFHEGLCKEGATVSEKDIPETQAQNTYMKNCRCVGHIYSINKYIQRLEGDDILRDILKRVCDRQKKVHELLCRGAIDNDASLMTHGD